MAPHSTTLKTYAERAAAHPNAAARTLLEIMDRKKTNLCVSVDVTKSADVLEVVRRVAPSVCMVKVSDVARDGAWM
jgi:orotidine-5'-phosphate decarboxylase